MGVNTLVSVRVPRQTWDSKEDLKPSQNPLFKADTYLSPVAERGILGLVQTKKRTPGHLRSLSLSTGGNWGQPRKKTRLN